MKPTISLNIQLVLHDLDSEIPYSQEAFELVCGTCAQESHYGEFLSTDRDQVGGGPALGIFQMEPTTFYDIVENFIDYNADLKDLIFEISNIDTFDANDLMTNDILATCMCRCHYRRVKESIPKDLESQAKYWKKYYNTPKGKGKVEEYIINYKKYVEV